MNNILIISDLHLGSPLFNKLRQFLTLIKSPEYDSIILNGDILDSWETKLENILLEYSNTIEVINIIAKEKPVYYVMGNHDPDIEKLRKVFPNVKMVPLFQIDDLFVIHGHEFDKLISKYSWLMKLLFIPHWIGERFGINIKAFFRNLTNSIANKRDKNYYKDLVRDINQAAIEKYKHMCKYIVMGHTHFPIIVESDECTYINSGDLIYNYTYVVFNNIDKTFVLKRI